jgi:hypothetical protein
LGTDLEGPFPTLVLERLEGTDLGDVIGDLDHASLDAIAGHVVAAQQAVQELPGAGRFGYAADAQDAPHSTWMDFLAASLSRSREHLARNALVNVRHADSVERLLTDIRDEAAKVQARPFLHDTTTKNVIVRPDGGFAGIVDVDDFCWGDARLAPALTLAAIQAFGGRECYVDTWMRQAGFSDDRLFRTYVVLMILGFLSEQGREFNGNEPAADVERTTRLVQVFEIAVANAWSR